MRLASISVSLSIKPSIETGIAQPFTTRNATWLETSAGEGRVQYEFRQAILGKRRRASLVRACEALS
jgi:hypothetical protein